MKDKAGITEEDKIAMKEKGDIDQKNTAVKDLLVVQILMIPMIDIDIQGKGIEITPEIETLIILRKDIKTAGREEERHQIIEEIVRIATDNKKEALEAIGENIYTEGIAGKGTTWIVEDKEKIREPIETIIEVMTGEAMREVDREKIKMRETDENMV